MDRPQNGETAGNEKRYSEPGKVVDKPGKDNDEIRKVASKPVCVENSIAGKVR